MTPEMAPCDVRIISPIVSTDNSMFCGLFGWHPIWLQKFANTKTFLLVYGLLGTMKSMAFIYFFVTLTTLEKRFKIPSQTTGILLTGNEISQILLSAVLAYAGGQKNRPRWIAWGIFSCSISCFILVIPHIIYGAGDDILELTEEYSIDNAINLVNSTSNGGQNTLCLPNVADIIPKCEEIISILPLIIIFISQFVLGVGNSLYHSLGKSYLDDNIEKTKTPMVLAGVLCLRMLGPLMGFGLGYVMLKIFIDPSKTPLITNKDPRWIGAYWLGWIIVGFAVMFFAFLIGMFPREFPNKNVIGQINEPYQNGVVSSKSEAAQPSLRGFLMAVIRLVKNRLLIYNILSLIFFILGTHGFLTFLSKYMEVQFNRNKADALIVTGPAKITGIIIGLLASGFIISKYKPKARTLFMWNIFVGISYIIGQTSYLFLSCENIEYPLENGRLNLTNDCNNKCSCDSVTYSPVCDRTVAITYFSACHAGCEEYDENAKLYRNCNCAEYRNKLELDTKNTNNYNCVTCDNHTKYETVTETINYEKTSNTFHPGVCLESCEYAFYTFNFIALIISMLGGTARIGNLLLNLRAVSTEDKSFAQGLTLMLISLFALIPGPILYGYIIDTTCIVWNYECGIRGNCQLYNQKNFRYLMNIAALSLISIGVIFDIFVWIEGKNINLYGDNEIKINTSKNNNNNSKIGVVSMNKIEDKI